MSLPARWSFTLSGATQVESMKWCRNTTEGILLYSAGRDAHHPLLHYPKGTKITFEGQVAHYKDGQPVTIHVSRVLEAKMPENTNSETKTQKLGRYIIVYQTLKESYPKGSLPMDFKREFLMPLASKVLIEGVVAYDTGLITWDEFKAIVDHHDQIMEMVKI